MKKIYTIGREENCDIVISDSTDVISRLHATIRVEANDKMFLIDQSRNGTYINGMKMTSNVEIPITRKDVISFAHIHELDWSLIPKPEKNWTKSILIALVCIAAVIGITLAAMTLLDKPKNSGKSGDKTTVADSVNKDTALTEVEQKTETTVSVSDTIQIPESPVKKKNETNDKNKGSKVKTKKEDQEIKDTIKPIEEETYNPIY